MKILTSLLRREDGAVTVDWVLITALAMGLALSAFGTVRSGTADLSCTISATVANQATHVGGSGGGSC